MKRLASGVLVLDQFDLVCLSLATGATIAEIYIILNKYYKRHKLKKSNILRDYEDPLVSELKKNSRQVIKLKNNVSIPLARGGDELNLKDLTGVYAFFIQLKNKRLAYLMVALMGSRRKKLRMLRVLFKLLNQSFHMALGIRFALSGDLNLVRVILIVFPYTIMGFILRMMHNYPLGTTLLPLLAIYARGIESVPNPYAQCEAICKALETYHNKQLKVEMQELCPKLEAIATECNLPLEEIKYVECIENKNPLSRPWELKKVTRSKKIAKQVQYYNEFIDKFPPCNAPDPDSDPGEVGKRLLEKAERLRREDI